MLLALLELPPRPPLATFAGTAPGLPRGPATRTRHPRADDPGHYVRPRWHDARMTRKAQYDHAALAKTLDAQLYVISRAQALACGLTVGALRHRIRPDGPWRILLPGVYLVDSREPNVMQREIAATLYAGHGSMITGVAALWRHDIRHPLSDIVDVLVPAPRKVQSTGFARVWRTNRLPARPWLADGIRVAPPPRAVADAALTLVAADEVRAIVADAVQRNRCTIPELTAELGGGPVRGSARFRLALAEVASGVRSVAEGDLRNLLRRGRVRGRHGDHRGHPARESWDAPVAPALPGRSPPGPGRPAAIIAAARLRVGLGVYPLARTGFHQRAPSRSPKARKPQSPSPTMPAVRLHASNTERV